MTPRRAGWLVVGILALLIVAVIAMTTVHAEGTDCGTPLGPADDVPYACERSIRDRQLLASGLGLFGAVTTFSVAVQASWTDRSPRDILGSQLKRPDTDT